MISLGATARAGLIAAMLFGAVQARAAEPAPVLNPAPTAQDWAAIAALPDWSGVWIPDIYAPTKTPPVWQPKFAAQVGKLQADEAAGRPHNFYINCLPEGMPSFVIMNLATSEFLFTPGRVTILNEFDGNRLRRIYTDGRGHPDDPDLTFNGHSIGHWEDGVLVVDTVGILPEAYLPLGQSVGIPNNGGMRIAERIHLIAPDTLRIDMVVDAPKVLAEPWKISRVFHRSRDRARDIVEASCRQGDFREDTDADGNAIFSPVAHDEGGAPLPPDASPRRTAKSKIRKSR